MAAKHRAHDVLDPDEAERLREALLSWYDGTRRDLPWRARPGAPADPWAVLVSEVMLQQTTAATVARRFAAFLERFPSAEAMAAAPLEDVLHAWQGLGYYRRARALHACARAIVAEHGGRVPADRTILQSLPGLGEYAAAAVAAIAFDRPHLAVDANVVRVGARLLGIARPPTVARRVVAAVLAPLVDGPRPGDTVQALMELGALLCRPADPACLACPWRPFCRAAHEGRPERFPTAELPRSRAVQTTVAFLLRRPDGALLLRRRPETGLLAGLVELPSAPWGPERPLEDCLAHAPAPGPWEPVPGEVRHVFTHLVLRARVVVGATDRPVEGLWYAPARLGEAALPTLTRKLLRHAGIRVPPAGG
ncbi:MAG: A/G-specific adenine glycosylase [Geminicoccaceae bacterium]|nr:A/G-specific adenine glycosylase [Geminicoccaceae bacterium]